MQLLVVRHGIAVPRGTPGIPDEKRPLTPEGEERFKEAAAGIAHLFEPPDALLTSPWLRAQQTAAILGKAWRGVEPTDTPALAGRPFADQAVVLDRYPRKATVAIVGHEPHLSSLLARLVGTRHGERLEMKKGGIAVVDVPGRLAEGGTLLMFVPPRLLRRLA